MLDGKEVIQIRATGLYEWDRSKMMDLDIGRGASSSVHRVKSGIIVKVPRQKWWGGDPKDMEVCGGPGYAKEAFEREEEILNRLGVHPRIIRCVFLS